MSMPEDLIEENFLRLLRDVLELRRKGLMDKKELKVKRIDVERYAILSGSDVSMKRLPEISALEFIEWKRKFKVLLKAERLEPDSSQV